jgi:hypothetical protein
MVARCQNSDAVTRITAAVVVDHSVEQRSDIFRIEVSKADAIGVVETQIARDNMLSTALGLTNEVNGTDAIVVAAAAVPGHCDV